MPPSQLKRLKASLREQGVLGPQKSKKQLQQSQKGKPDNKRVERAAALNGIREQFNPFEYRHAARAPKFDVTTNKPAKNGAIKGQLARPGQKRSAGEDNRRKTLLVDMQRRNKAGGILDRRFGENDPTMAPEDKMLERFTQERQSHLKRSSAFDLEDDGEFGELTHGGHALSLDGPMLDDFDEAGLGLSDEDDDEHGILRKRRRLTELASGEDIEEEENEEEEAPARKKSKQEVMKEIIAKSKMHKYERQAAKDEDEDMRIELDKELADIHMLLRGVSAKQTSKQDAQDSSKEQLGKDYDVRLKQLARDKKSAPTERTKTEEEKLEEESRRLRQLEAKRLKRMQGEPTSDDEQDAEALVDEDDEQSDADYGLGSGLKPATETKEDFAVEDEDDFIIDEDLVASGSDYDAVEGDSDIDSAQGESDQDDDFVDGLLTKEELQRPEFLTGANAAMPDLELPAENGIDGNLSFTFPCPQSLDEMLDITQKVAVIDLPIVVQRIRMLHHPKLRPENKERMAQFSVTLVHYVAHLGNEPHVSFNVLETLIRHIHSLAKSYPVDIGNTFRAHIRTMHEERPLNLTAGDLVLLTAIGSIFPTSDHFHQVVTPAVLVMTRYLGQKVPSVLSDYVKGAYINTLCLKYQQLSKRYVPEFVGFALNSLGALAPTKLATQGRSYPQHESKPNMRINKVTEEPERLSFSLINGEQDNAPSASSLSALMHCNVKLIEAAADLWADKPAFIEVFEPTLDVLRQLLGPSCRGSLSNASRNSVKKALQKLEGMVKQATTSRRPLELHHHRPLAIKTSIPKFEESFNPDKHYDPDRERAEAAKLKAEYKKERKGAMRELRKDSNFIARESLRQKKERDAAYEKKFKKIIAEINQEEGKEAKAYEREKEWRKKGRK